jgi:hypothetical protein
MIRQAELPARNAFFVADCDCAVEMSRRTLGYSFTNDTLDENCNNCICTPSAKKTPAGCPSGFVYHPFAVGGSTEAATPRELPLTIAEGGSFAVELFLEGLSDLGAEGSLCAARDFFYLPHPTSVPVSLAHCLLVSEPDSRSREPCSFPAKQGDSLCNRHRRLHKEFLRQRPALFSHECASRICKIQNSVRQYEWSRLESFVFGVSEPTKNSLRGQLLALLDSTNSRARQASLPAGASTGWGLPQSAALGPFNWEMEGWGTDTEQTESNRWRS